MSERADSAGGVEMLHERSILGPTRSAVCGECRTAEIDATPERCCEVLTDYERLPEWVAMRSRGPARDGWE